VVGVAAAEGFRAAGSVALAEVLPVVDAGLVAPGAARAVVPVAMKEVVSDVDHPWKNSRNRPIF